ncbi:hypothetical protein U1Q18_017022 [Sarracenia purpurea var. burkii]
MHRMMQVTDSRGKGRVHALTTRLNQGLQEDDDGKNRLKLPNQRHRGSVDGKGGLCRRWRGVVVDGEVDRRRRRVLPRVPGYHSRSREMPRVIQV